MWGRKEHMMGGMDMMSEKMMEMMSKEDLNDDVCYEDG